MTKLLIMACGARKRVTDQPLWADYLYIGPLWQTFRKYRKHCTGEVLLILSAEHGLIPAHTKLMPYDRRMDAARADELRRLVHVDKASGVIHKAVPEKGPHVQVAVCGGRRYVDVACAYVEYAHRCGFLPSPTPDRIINNTIGRMRSELREWLELPTCD